VRDTIASLISGRAAILEQAGIDQAEAEIELVLCHLLDTDRFHLYLEGASRLSHSNVKRLDDIVARRSTRYPLQYILLEAWFFGRKFFVCPDVMAPTPETELLCETAIGFVRERRLDKPRILDLGVGSGVIAVTLALELDDCAVLAVDVSPEALDVARRNAATLGAIDRIEFRVSDFFASIPRDDTFNLIVSNPPYVAEHEYETLPPEVKADPKIALLAGRDGLDAIRVILRDAPKHLSARGRLMFEIGYGQADRVGEMTEPDDRYRSITILKDLNQIDRVVILSCDE